MRIGKVIDHSHDVGVVPPKDGDADAHEGRYGLLAAVSASILLAMLAKRKKIPRQRASGTPNRRQCSSPRKLAAVFTAWL